GFFVGALVWSAQASRSDACHYPARRVREILRSSGHGHAGGRGQRAGSGQAALAGTVDGAEVDACVAIDHDAEVSIITARDAAGLDIIRHSCAHLLGQALKTLYPDVKMAIGPVIDEGFYYDIALDRTLTPEDLEQIEQRMLELARHDYDVIREVVSRERALATFEQRNEPYKQAIVEGIPDGETIALYHHEDYTDMCTGPHVPNSRHLRAFKIGRASCRERGEVAVVAVYVQRKRHEKEHE